MLGVSELAAPFKGGVLVPSPDVLLPLLWLVLLPNPGEEEPEEMLGRTLLVVLAHLHFLVAFPVAGAQLSLAVLLFAPCAALLRCSAIAGN